MTRKATFVEIDSMSLSPRDLPDRLLAQGRYAFTLAEATSELGTTPAATRQALARLQRRKEVFSPTKGLYVAIPSEYRTWGVLPGEWFIDAMMRHLGRPYYVALLSAAQIHGASHQAPQVFQVMTEGTPLRDRDLGRVRLRLYTSQHVGQDGTVQVTVPTGYATVSARETTAVDLVSQVPLLTAISNDKDFTKVFVDQLQLFGKKGDMALVISTSGHSPNLVYALETARAMGMMTIAFSGKDGGRIAGLADYCFTVPSFSVHRIQESHVALLHMLWDLVHVALGEEDVI